MRLLITKKNKEGSKVWYPQQLGIEQLFLNCYSMVVRSSFLYHSGSVARFYQYNESLPIVRNIVQPASPKFLLLRNHCEFAPTTYRRIKRLNLRFFLTSSFPFLLNFRIMRNWSLLRWRWRGWPFFHTWIINLKQKLTSFFITDYNETLQIMTCIDLTLFIYPLTPYETFKRRIVYALYSL